MPKMLNCFHLAFEARVTAWSCQWLMGASSVNSIDLPDGSSCSSGRDANIWKKTFFKDYMGIPLYMEPKFSDYSCQIFGTYLECLQLGLLDDGAPFGLDRAYEFNFGVPPPPRSSDSALREPCLEICPNANRRKELNKGLVVQCPKV
ncbi:hypothetical protein M5K25_011066 [Dendrobium thyrsiflorum]|uniref:Beta-carotene isomerase D27-like C-terminal domain-containing protein n=1 Tax=Dendrobium thyrsiflorum TaxID=117978 RepID=A0ABD0V1V6_DENTH